MAKIIPICLPPKKKYFADGQQWLMTEGAYASMQSTKPMTAACGLNDSPAGLAAWIVEKFRAWSDCAGEVERRFSKDELLTNLTIYWATETIGSSFLYYYEPAHDQQPRAVKKRVEVPTGFACESAFSTGSAVGDERLAQMA